MAKKSITVRFSEHDAAEIEEVARAARKATGEQVSVSDVVREAVSEYLKGVDNNAGRD